MFIKPTSNKVRNLEEKLNLMKVVLRNVISSERLQSSFTCASSTTFMAEIYPMWMIDLGITKHVRGHMTSLILAVAI